MNDTAFDFSAIGFLVLDTLCRTADEMPPKGGATFVEQIRMTPSGTAGGTAMICGHFGLNGQLVTEVGQDDAGDFLVSKLQTTYGIATDLIFRNTTGVQTSCSVLPIGSSGERAAFFCPGTAATFYVPPNKIDAALHAKIIHLGGTGLLTKMDGQPSLDLLKRAKEQQKITVFDLILANSDSVKLVDPLFPYIDYFVPSIEEAAALTNGVFEMDSRDAPNIARYFKAKGVKNVILTLDKDGVYVDPEEGDAFIQPAHDIQVVDSTGCGDSFTAGIIVGITNGYDLQKTVRFANAVAAQVAMGLGSDGSGILTSSIDDTLKFMQSTPFRTKSKKERE